LKAIREKKQKTYKINPSKSQQILKGNLKSKKGME
jgi:hypothetical protein